MDNNLLINKTNLGSKNFCLTDNGKIIYLYKTTNIINNYIYVGVKTLKSKNISDNYIGCGVEKYINGKISLYNGRSPFIQAVKKFGFDSFKKEILLYFKNPKEALLAEKHIVDEEFIKFPYVYNKIIGGGLPPTGSGKDNNNWGNKWTDEQKQRLSKLKKDLKLHIGNKNPKAKRVDLYDFLEDKRYNLSYIRETEIIIGYKIDYNWKSIMNYRYILILPNENPYKRVEILKKPIKTLKIIQCIKMGLSIEECKNKLNLNNSGLITRIYKAILNENNKH